MRRAERSTHRWWVVSVSVDVGSPVVVVIFRRADLTRQLVASLRAVRPGRVFVVADGPRPHVPDDPHAVALARAEIEGIDWPCTVEWIASDANLGCSERICSGLDAVFELVPRAIVVEDDVAAHPSFFFWCDRLLERYESVPEVAQLCGHNRLGRYGDDDGDHLIARRSGSVWGWATWARSWQQFRHRELPRFDLDAVSQLHGVVDDPLVAEHLLLQAGRDTPDLPTSWDLRWALHVAMAQQLSVVSTRNLTHNLGFRPDAVHTTFEESFAGQLPALVAASPGASGPALVVDPHFDRWCVIAELMATYRNPAMARRLAASPSMRARLADQPGADHHLAPFDDVGAARRVLAAIRSTGLASPQLEAIAAALGESPPESSNGSAPTAAPP
jgi:hypothetical protein